MIENKAVCRKCDPEANKTNGKEIENEAVRHKSDMDAEVMTASEIETENDAVRPKSDMDADVFEEDAKNEQEHVNEAAAAKKTLEVNDEFWEKVVKIRRIVVERRNTSKSEKNVRKIEQIAKNMHQRQEKNEKSKNRFK